MFDLQTQLDNAMGAARKKVMDQSLQLTLGELIIRLEAIPDKTIMVSINNPEGIPGYLHSWRGVYAELALESSQSGDLSTVDKLLQRLKKAVGETFIGYKGGDFTMGKTTPIWVSQYGDAEHNAVIGVEVVGGAAILQTKEMEPYD